MVTVLCFHISLLIHFTIGCVLFAVSADRGHDFWLRSKSAESADLQRRSDSLLCQWWAGTGSFMEIPWPKNSTEYVTTVFFCQIELLSWGNIVLSLSKPILVRPSRTHWATTCVIQNSASPASLAYSRRICFGSIRRIERLEALCDNAL